MHLEYAQLFDKIRQSSEQSANTELVTLVKQSKHLNTELSIELPLRFLEVKKLRNKVKNSSRDVLDHSMKKQMMLKIEEIERGLNQTKLVVKSDLLIIQKKISEQLKGGA